MRNGLLDTHPRPLLIIKRSKGKRESASLLLNLGKDGSGSLHLQLVVGIPSLVDGCSRRIRLGLYQTNQLLLLNPRENAGGYLAVGTGDDQDIYTINFTLVKRRRLMVPPQLW